MKNKKIIVKVFQTKYNKQKYVTIPASSDIEKGDYVLIEKVEAKK
jgi:hypothetical protein